MRLPVPPKEEQLAILGGLGSILKKTKVLTATLQKSITLAKERRAALITASVTGQIPVEEMTR